MAPPVTARPLGLDERLDELLARLASRSASPMESYEARSNPGLLGRIGETLDIPGRLVRETLTGRPGATGRDVLGMGANAPGLDAGDVAGFAAEVALDPLNLISGIGVATKAGRGAERAAKLTADLNAARKLAGAAEVAGQAGERAIQIKRALEARRALQKTRAALEAEGAETTLRKGWRAQAQAPVPQRALLSVGLPFTEGVPLIRGGRVLGALEGAGRAVAGSPPGRLARKLFDPGLVRNVLRPGEFVPRSQEGRALMEASEGGVQRAVQDTAKYQEELAAQAAQREAAGIPMEEHFLGERRIRESLGVPESAGRKAAEIIATGKAKGKELEERWMALRAKKNEAIAKDRLRAGDARAKEYERAALELEKVATQGTARQQALWGQAADTLSKGRDLAGEIMKAPLTPARAARILRGQKKIWADMNQWSVGVQRKMLAVLERRGLHELRAKGAAFPESLTHLGAKARAEFKIGELAALVRRIQDRGLAGIDRELQEGIAEFHRVLGDKAERVMRHAKSRSAVLDRGASELGRLKLERRVQKLRERAAEARDRALEGWKAAPDIPLQPIESLRLFEAQTGVMQKAHAASGEFIRRGQEAKGILKAATPEDIALGERMGGVNEELVQQQIASGARPESSYFNDPKLAYAERIMTPEGWQALVDAGLLDDLGRHMESRGAVLGGGDMHHRVERWHDVYTDAINEYMQKKFPNLKGDWIQMDYSKSSPMHFLSGRMRIEAAKVANAAIESFPNLAHTPGQTMALEEFLTQSPLYRFRGQSISGDPAVLKKQLAEMGMAGRGVPIDVASQVLEQQAKLTSPEEMQKLLGMYDDVTKIWKIGATLPFLGHHAKNLTGNTVLQWVFNMADPRVMAEAFKRAVLAPLRGDNSWLREAEQVGILKGTQLTELLDTGGVRKSAQTPITGRLFDRFPKLKSAAEKSKKYTQLVENFSRTWGYLSRLKAGDTPMEAARATRKVLLDYSELTDFERLAMRRVIPFYSWTRKVLPRLLESFVKEPRKAALAIRTTTQPTVDRGGVVPEFVRQSGAIPAGVDDQGSQRFIYGLGSPYEELNKLDITSPEGGVFGGLKKLGRAVGSQANPFIKAPVELATGHELFFDRDIIHGDRAEPILSKIPGLAQALEIQEEQTPSGKRLRGDPYLLWALRQLPGSRGIREAGSLANAAVGIDPRGNRLNDLLTFLTGARTTTVGDADRVRTMQDINRRLATKLVREGKLGQVPTQFATALGKTDEETLGLLKEQQRLRKELDRLRGEDPDELERMLQRESRKLQRAGR